MRIYRKNYLYKQKFNYRILPGWFVNSCSETSRLAYELLLLHSATAEIYQTGYKKFFKISMQKFFTRESHCLVTFLEPNFAKSRRIL